MDIVNEIKIDKHSKKPLYIQIADAIKALIEEKTLVADDQLPAIRKLAQNLSVNNFTIVNAYKLLANEGITYVIKGSGSYISTQDADINALANKIIIAENQIESQMKISEKIINFATATPKSNLFPVAEFKSSVNYILDRDLGEAFGYQEAKGYYPLRESISSYLSKTDIFIPTSDIQIISGAQQGLDIVAKALLNHGDTVIVEAPTYSGAIASFRSRGVKVIQTPIGNDGINMKKFEDLVKRYGPKLMYTMTNCQNPTGYSYSDEKKTQLLDIANKYDMYIVEDDYVGELIFTKQKTAPLKANPNSEKVIYIKSFSKILMPGLRLGFMAVPENLNKLIQKAKQATDISTSGLIQRTFDIYLREGYWEKQLKNMKDIYKKRFDVMVMALNKYLPRKVKFYVPRGGILFWLELPKTYDSRTFFKGLTEDRISFVPGDLFYYNEEKSCGIRLSIASVDEKDIEIGIKYLAEQLKTFLK